MNTMRYLSARFERHGIPRLHNLLNLTSLFYVPDLITSETVVEVHVAVRPRFDGRAIAWVDEPMHPIAENFARGVQP